MRNSREIHTSNSRRIKDERDERNTIMTIAEEPVDRLLHDLHPFQLLKIALFVSLSRIVIFCIRLVLVVITDSLVGLLALTVEGGGWMIL